MEEDMDKRFAFTLAEVLITLGIIGVVAALTLPALLTNQRNAELSVGLKKTYSTFAQALDMYQAENGIRVKSGTVTYRREVKNILVKYIKSAVDCGWGGSDNAEELSKSCLPNNYLNVSGSFNPVVTYKTFDGNNTIRLDYFDDGQFVMVDGMFVMVENSQSHWFADQIFISVDVNGFEKKPNMLGYDLFMFEVDKNGKLLPMGAKGTTYETKSTYCSKNSSNSMNGAACTYYALTDKDYFKNLK